jgi:hypothetical protein
VCSLVPYCREGLRKVFARRMYRRINYRSHVWSSSSSCGDFNASRGIQRGFASYYKVKIIHFFTTARPRRIKEDQSLESFFYLSDVDPDPDPHGSTMIWLFWVRILIGIADPDPGAWNLIKINKYTWFPAFQQTFVPS